MIRCLYLFINEAKSREVYNGWITKGRDFMVICWIWFILYLLYAPFHSGHDAKMTVLAL